MCARGMQDDTCFGCSNVLPPDLHIQAQQVVHCRCQDPLTHCDRGRLLGQLQGAVQVRALRVPVAQLVGDARGHRRNHA